MNLGGWFVTRDKEDERYTHVVPIDDLREHTNVNCWCNPRTNEYNTIIHNAMDRRTDYETGDKKLS